MSVVAFLGPQRLKPTLRAVATRLGVRGRVAAITAGWEERETEDDELTAHLGRDTVNLRLFHRAEEVLRDDGELAGAARTLQDRLGRIRELYRFRLSHALKAARGLLRREQDPDILAPEQVAAVDAVRALDDHHVGRVRRELEAFHATWRLAEREVVAEHRAAMRGLVDGCDAIAVAGGHVGVLLAVLRLFDVAGVIEDRPVLAWSAGAMTLAERIALFHDSPPQGQGNAEVLAEGLGIVRGVLPLPHARRRLRLDDAVRVGLFARRFAPLTATVLDEGTLLAWRGSAPIAAEGARRLTEDGRVLAVTKGAGAAR